MSWIKRLAVDEALRTKGFRFVIYLRVPSDAPTGYFESPEPITVCSKRKTVQTIRLPSRELPREYDIQGIGHFESMYGEALWKNKVTVSTYYKLERLRNIPKVRGGCHLQLHF